MTEKKFILTFSQQQVNAPVTFRMARDYDLEINILRAEVNELGGKLILSMAGKNEEIEKAVAFLEDNRIQVNELNRFVVRDESRCTDCSMCVSICPVKAYRLDKETWKVVFDQDKCIACGMCVDACPPGAISRGRMTLDTT